MKTEFLLIKEICLIVVLL